MEPMTAFPWIDVATILALVALNGLFAMSELAIVSARKPRLQALEKAGRRGARTALDLASDPGKFLSTVQIGITLIGILAGAYRSEEHTSELQSLMRISYAVFCLNKKNKNEN